MERVLVTGGAGFIASHLIDRLLEEYDVVVLDDLSGGELENIQQHMNKDNFNFIKGSITSAEDISRCLEGVITVFHFAAQADVRLSIVDPMLDFRINVLGGMTLLETLRNHDVSRIIFASSGGTVYGDAEVIPTPENTRLAPISNYGAAKCAFEMYLSSYSELYGMSAISLRLANIIGPRMKHGIIFDLSEKLRKDSTRLEVLGTGKQEKAYMYVSDTVEATTILADRMKKGHFPVNISSGERLTVSRIVELVCEVLDVPDTRIEYTGSERGWAGDVVVTDPDIGLLKKFGWTPKVKLEDGVRKYLKWLIEKYGPIS